MEQKEYEQRKEDFEKWKQEIEQESRKYQEIINSPHFEDFLDILQRFLDDAKLDLRESDDEQEIFQAQGKYQLLHNMLDLFHNKARGKELIEQHNQRVEEYNEYMGNVKNS